MIFAAVVAARVLVPLGIPRFPLPVMLACLVIDGQVFLQFLSGAPLEHAVVLILLLTLIVTLYDQYRTIYLARFSSAA